MADASTLKIFSKSYVSLLMEKHKSWPKIRPAFFILRIPMRICLLLLTLACSFTACVISSSESTEPEQIAVSVDSTTIFRQKISLFAPVKLNVDVSHLSANQRQMLPRLKKAARIMDDLYWKQSYGEKQKLLQSIHDSLLKKLILWNYGPYDRLSGNEPLMPNIPPRADGANFYPPSLTRANFEKLNLPDKANAFTNLAQDDSGDWQAIFYHEIYRNELDSAASYLRQAGRLAENQAFQTYLNRKADDLLTDHYAASDLAWLNVADYPLDIIIGPIETYEDKLLGYKAAYQACVMVKNEALTKRIQRFANLLSPLYDELPLVRDRFIHDVPENDKIGVYEGLYFTGLFNSGSKSTGLNAPRGNYPGKSKRKILFNNIIQAKYEHILRPLADILVKEDQRSYVNANAFFNYVLFHEIAHGLGVIQTESGESVQQALKQYASILEEGKGDILGLYLITYLFEKREKLETSLEEHYVTFLASVLRSVRFGMSSEHGRANMLRFHFFLEAGAFVYDEVSKTYGVNFEKMPEAIKALTDKILTIQYKGDIREAAVWIRRDAKLKSPLIENMGRLTEKGVPVDLVFETEDG